MITNGALFMIGPNPKRIVAETLPNLLSGAKYVPIFRYLREAGHFDAADELIETGLHERVMKAAGISRGYFFPPQAYQGERSEVEQVLKCIEAVVIRYGFNAFYYLPMLLPKQVNVPDLKSYIVSNLQLSTDKSHQHGNVFSQPHLLLRLDCVRSAIAHALKALCLRSPAYKCEQIVDSKWALSTRQKRMCIAVHKCPIWFQSFL